MYLRDGRLPKGTQPRIPRLLPLVRRAADGADLGAPRSLLPAVPERHWVLSFRWPPRFLFANRPELTWVLAIVTRAVEASPTKSVGLARNSGARSGIVTLIQRFGISLSLTCSCICSFLTAYSQTAMNTNVFTQSRRPMHRRCRDCSIASRSACSLPET